MINKNNILIFAKGSGIYFQYCYHGRGNNKVFSQLSNIWVKNYKDTNTCIIKYNCGQCCNLVSLNKEIKRFIKMIETIITFKD